MCASIRSLNSTQTHNQIRELPDCKPVSVPARATVIPLGLPLLTGSSDLPGSQAGRAAPSPLFGLAPRGVYPAGGITPAAVRSYRTISPLPLMVGQAFRPARRGRLKPATTIQGGIFSVALSVSRWGPRPLAGTLLYGDRTFLLRFRRRLPIRQLPQPIISCCADWVAEPREFQSKLVQLLRIFRISGVKYKSLSRLGLESVAMPGPAL